MRSIARCSRDLIRNLAGQRGRSCTGPIWSREQAYIICSVAVDLRVSNVDDLSNVTVSAFLYRSNASRSSPAFHNRPSRGCRPRASPALSSPARHGQTAPGRSPPCCGPLRRGSRGALGGTQEPGVRNGCRRGRCRRGSAKRAVDVLYVRPYVGFPSPSCAMTPHGRSAASAWMRSRAGNVSFGRRPHPHSVAMP
jgi:hypothetical protein